MGFNATPENLSKQTNMTEVGLKNATGDIHNTVAQQMMGSAEFTGIFVLLLFGLILYKAETSVDTSAVIMVPTTFVLARYGFLPGGQGIVFGLLLAVAAVFGLGLVKFLTR